MKKKRIMGEANGGVEKNQHSDVFDNMIYIEVSHDVLEVNISGSKFLTSTRCKLICYIIKDVKVILITKP